MKRQVGIVALAYLATLASAWPLTTLFESNTWMGPVVTLMVLLGAVGLSLRQRGTAALAIAAAQLAMLAVALMVIYTRPTLSYGLPTSATLARLEELTLDGVTAVRDNAAPVPMTVGLEMGVVALVLVFAILVDGLAISRRAPAAAGLALLGLYLVSSANSGSELAVMYFVVAAGLWLGLLASLGMRQARVWGTSVTTGATTSVYGDAQADALRLYGQSARRLTAVGLLAAIAVSIFVPHLPTRFLVDGLGRNPDGIGGGSAVGLSTTLDVGRSLRAAREGTVLRYTTSVSTPSPLRVIATSRFTGREWVPDRDATTPGVIPSATDVPADEVRTFEAFDNTVRGPYFALPRPLLSVTAEGVELSTNTTTGDVLGSSDAVLPSYSATFVDPVPDEQALRSPDSGGAGILGESLRLDRRSADAVQALVDEVTATAPTPYDAAVAIQEHLRTTGGFVYTLTPADPGPGEDAITSFLRQKRGYCVQFASAMIFMSRALGIPARMAIGFLPGTRSNNIWTVTSADAHAWPELWFPSSGWIRFEPTPASQSGGAPAWSLAADSPERPSTASASGNTNSREPGEPTASASATGSEGGAADAGLTGVPGVLAAVGRWLAAIPPLVVVAVLLGIAAAFVMPLTARYVYRSRRRAADTRAERVEVAWWELTSVTSDLGLSPPTSDTPREALAYYLREGHLSGPARESMSRLGATLELARYAPSDAIAADDLARAIGDVDDVTKAVAAGRATRLRVRARLWPSAGVRFWQDQAGRAEIVAADLAQAPIRWWRARGQSK